MLLEFGAKNFFSFKEGFELSLRLGKTCPAEVSNNKKFSNILAIKGANASGKTNVIKVLSFLHSFVTLSFSSLTPENKTGVEPHFRNKDTVSLFAIFQLENTEYKYEIDLTRDEVISETISIKKQRWTNVVHRNKNSVTASGKFKELEHIKLNRKNASIVSIAKQYGISEIDTIYSLFDNIMTNVNVFGRVHNENLLPVDHVSSIYFDNQSLLIKVGEFLRRADTGIDKIEIIETIDQETNKKNYFPLFHYTLSEGKKNLIFDMQSSGVKSLFLQLGLYFSSLDVGSILALDEFDVNLHPDILPHLLELFEDEKTNIKNAQLIFTTHNCDVMDRLGKYRTVLVNKKNNESFLYRLDEIPGDILRNDRPISPLYNANKIGGKPIIQ